MINWFYHDPASGRMGPFSTQDLLDRHRTRMIQADTLVWHDAMREWQSLERAMAAQDTVLGPQDTSLPPPLPAHAPVSARPAHNGVAAHTARPVAARPEKKGMSGCLIALLIGGALGVVMLAMLAAIALPAYRDYTIKAKVMQAIQQSEPVQDAMVDFVNDQGRCPRDGDPGFDDPARFATPVIQSVELGVGSDGACAYAMALRGLGGDLDGSTAVVAMRDAGDHYEFEYECDAGTLPERFGPRTCSTAP